MEIKVNDNPVTIKTITIGKNKLTKQMLQQMPYGYYVYHFNKDNRKCLGVLRKSVQPDNGMFDIEDNYHFDGKMLGWVNLIVDNPNEVRQFISTNEQLKDYKNSLTLILYVDNDGILKKSYLDNYTYALVYENMEQIYI
jgi:hypothetical protein